jgi:hypothetical protein
MSREPTGRIEQLPSGSYWVSVYAGTDPLTRQPIRLRATAKGETQALDRDRQTPKCDATLSQIY